MKTPEKILSEANQNIFAVPRSTVIGLLKIAQKDAWNAALEWAAENAEANGSMGLATVSKESILNGKI